MSFQKMQFQYLWTRFLASRERDTESGEVSATTVVMAAALIALAITVGATITSRVRDKANSLDIVLIQDGTWRDKSTCGASSACAVAVLAFWSSGVNVL